MRYNILNRNIPQGSAMVMVIGAMLVLSAIATPFAISMAFHRKTATLAVSEVEARFAAEAGLNHAIEFLYNTHIAFDPTPGWDGEEEFRVQTEGLSSELTLDPDGLRLSVKIEDEQGKVNIFQPNLSLRWLRNLCGWSTLTQTLGQSSTTAIVEDTSFLNPNGGYVQIGNEVIYYLKAEGTTLIGLERGVEGGGDAEEHLKDSIMFATRYTFLAGSNARATSIEMENIIADSVEEISPFITRYSWTTSPASVNIAPSAPVNMNTAKHRVLAAGFRGLRISVLEDYEGDPNSGQDIETEIFMISVDQSRIIADAIMNVRGGTPIQNDQQAEVAISSAIISPDSRIDQYLKLATRLPIGLASQGFWYQLDDTTWYFLNNNTGRFNYRSFDTVTIESTAFLQYPNGMQRTAFRIRQVMDFDPPEDVVVPFSTQADFEDRTVNLHASMVTTPNLVGYQAPSQSEGTLRPFAHSTPLRRLPYAPPTNDLHAETQDDLISSNTFYFINGTNPYGDYDAKPEGLEMNGGEFALATDTLFGANVGMDNACMSESVIGFWFQPKSAATSFVLMDMKGSEDEETTDRLTLRWNVETSSMELEVGDASIKENLATHSALFDMEDDYWYYLEVIIQSDQMDGVGFLVDGVPVPMSHSHVTTLSEPLDADALLILVEDASMFDPDGGIVKLGNGLTTELIEYSEINEDQLIIDDIAFRRARHSTGLPGQSFPIGTRVELFGYRAPLVEPFTRKIAEQEDITIETRLLTNGGSLATVFGEATDAVITGVDPVLLDSFGQIIPYEDDDIGFKLICNGSDLDAFPPEGWIKVRNEIIYYSSIDIGTVWDGAGLNPLGEAPGFVVSARKACQTTKGNQFLHPLTIPTFMSGFAVNQHENYHLYSYLQIDDEWFGPLQKMDDQSKKMWSIPVNSNDIPLAFMPRGFPIGDPTTRQKHAVEAMVIQVTRYGIGLPGPGDIVTMLKKDGTKEEMTVHLADTASTTVLQGLCAFTEWTSSSYGEPDLGRMLKFPSGELPSEFEDTDTYFGTDADGGNAFEGWFDDLTIVCANANTIHSRDAMGIPIYNGRHFSFPMLLTTAIQESTETISMSGHPNFELAHSIGGGYVHIGNEWIGIVPVVPGTVQEGAFSYKVVERAAFGSEETDHAPGVSAYAWSPLLSSALESAASESASTVILRYANVPSLFSPAHMQLGDEVIGFDAISLNESDYTGDQTGQVTITLPKDEDDEPLLRGAFGTIPEFHDDETIAVFRYARYPDRYTPRLTQGISLPVYEYQRYFRRQARWKSISWKENDLQNVKARVFTRFDMRPAWNVEPAIGYGKLNQVSNASTINILSDLMELRILFEYEDGAWEAGSWKQSPYLDEFEVRYQADNLVLFYEEFRY